MIRDRSFLGRGWAFPPSFDPATRAPVMAAEEDDIAQSLHILLATHLGERVMLPLFGLPPHVFAMVDENAKTEIARHVEDAIIQFEPRIRVLAINLDWADGVDGRLDLAIEYEIPAINARGNMVFPFYHDEGTHVRAL